VSARSTWLTLSREEYAALLRSDLASFVARVFAHLDPHTPYSPNWHIDLIADRLTQVYEGRLRRLIINVPPRSLKSICASVAFPAWVLGRAPATRMVCASYGQDLSTKLARDCVAIMSAPWYQQLFPTRLAAARSPMTDFETTARGGRMATSVGGVLTGRGGDILIIDDPVKPDEALSEVQRKTANDWFDNTLYSRLNDKRTGAIVVIMQRLHLDDLAGHVLEKEDWEVVNLPAIALQDEEWTYATALGKKRIFRRAGKPLHPEREPLEVLQTLHQTLGEYVFSAQYQQAPVPMGGALIKTDWFIRYPEPPVSFDRIVQSWDTANKQSELSDYSVCTTWGEKGKHCYLLHVLRKRLEYPELKRMIGIQAAQWSARVVLIEDKASGTQLIQELRDEPYSVRGIQPEGDKVMRAVAQTAQIENGFVHIPVSAPWLNEYLQELGTFPYGKFDDQVDSTAQALKWIGDEGREPAFLVYMRREAARCLGISEEEYLARQSANRTEAAASLIVATQNFR